MGDDIVLTLNSIAKINSIKNNATKLHYIFKMQKIACKHLGLSPMLGGGGGYFLLEYHVA